MMTYPCALHGLLAIHPGSSNITMHEAMYVAACHCCALLKYRRSAHQAYEWLVIQRLDVSSVS